MKFFINLQYQLLNQFTTLNEIDDKPKKMIIIMVKQLCRTEIDRFYWTI